MNWSENDLKKVTDKGYKVNDSKINEIKVLGAKVVSGFKKPKTKHQNEYLLQKQICQYLKSQYPSVYFLSDTVASVKLTQTQQGRNKAVQCQIFKCPDLLIFEPNDKFKGLFIELKTQSPFKKDGTIKASQNNHLENQQSSLNSLNKKGYCAVFSWGFEMTKKIIDNYLKTNNNSNLILSSC